MNRVEDFAHRLAEAITAIPRPSEEVIRAQAMLHVRQLLDDAKHWLAVRSGQPDEVLAAWLDEEVEDD